MRPWEWCVWAVLALGAFFLRAVAVFAAALLGSLLGLVSYVALENGVLWVMLAALIAIVAAASGLVGSIELYDHLDRKRVTRRRTFPEESNPHG